MRAILYFILLILAVTSILLTIKDIVTGQYYQEIENIKSIENLDKYMDVDGVKIEHIFDDDPSSSKSIGKHLKGKLLSNDSIIYIHFYSDKSLNQTLGYQPVYRSKLTGRYFLKDAPKRYYKVQIRGLYAGIYLKVAFYFIMIFLIYKLIIYIRNRKYQLTKV